MNFVHRERYTVHRFDNGSYAVVKVINEYRSEQEASDATVDLACRKITEDELLDEYAKKSL